MLPIIAAVVVIAAISLIFMKSFYTKRRQTPTYVIGREMAAARRAEAEHFQTHPESPSPLPSVKYDFWQGDLDLISPSERETDQKLAEFLTAFSLADTSSREHMRSRMTMDDFYQLMTFSKRMAVFGLRTGNRERLKLGMIAVAAIDVNRVDYRDPMLALSLICHSADRNAVDAQNLMYEVLGLGMPKTAELMSGLVDRSPEQRNIRSQWGFDEVSTDIGLGFIGWGFEPYQPSYDLKALAVESRSMLAADRYQAASVQVATNIPEVWFTLETTDQQASLTKAIQSVRGAATINGKLRPEHHPRSDAQQFTIFLAECSDDNDSSFLESIGTGNSQRHASVAANHGCLFSLAVARSFIGGVESYETQQLMDRFRQPLAHLLGRGQRLNL